MTTHPAHAPGAPTASTDRRSIYERDGYVVVRGVIDRERALGLGRAADALTTRRAPGVHLQWTRAGEPSLVKIPQLGFEPGPFQDLAHDPRLVDVVEELLGPGARLFRDVVVGKPARTGGSLSAHQDSAYWDVEPKALVSAWVALTDVPADRSPLEVVAGTHRAPIPHGLLVGERLAVPAPVVRALRAAVSLAGTGDSPSRTGGSPALWQLKSFVLGRATRAMPWLAGLQDYRVMPETMASLDAVALPVEAGDVVLFHSLLVHGTPPNRTDAPRYAHIVSYMPTGSRCGSRGADHFPAARRP